jgi:glutaminase
VASDRETRDGAPFVSTGTLPGPDVVQAWIDEAHERYRHIREGRPSEVYPALAQIPGELFGICVVGTSGRVHRAGDADREFPIMSVSKPFVFALVCAVLGAVEARASPACSRATGGCPATPRRRSISTPGSAH